MAFPNSPYVDQNTQDRPRPLKFVTGAEVSKSIVVAASTVTANDNGQRIVRGGTVLCKITSGHNANKYGPYLKTAGDGRDTLTELSCFITQRGYDVTLGDRAVDGLFQSCVFDVSELTTGGISKHGASLTSLAAVFPTCSFDD
jgi:hypothetical protein